jgi:hypothetical protein
MAERIEDNDLLTRARKRYSECVEYETPSREESRDDGKFAEGEQWDEEMRNERASNSRPCLTVNRIPQFLKQVTNEQRQNRHSVLVSGVDSDSDPQVAEVFQGIIRHIEVRSDAEVAYDTAAEHQAKIGFGFLRVLTDYIGDRTFDQEILIERIPNPFNVYIDPAANKADLSDARFCFVTEEIPKDAFKETYPGVDLTALEQWSDEGESNKELWVSTDNIRVAEYFEVETKRRRLVVVGGETAFWDEVASDELNAQEREMLEDKVEQERWVEERSVRWYKVVATEILEQKEWPGKWIPVVPVLGDESYLEGTRKLWGMVRFAKDPQRAYNYWNSAETEMIALAPKAPFIGPRGSFEDMEREWGQANTTSYGYLEYTPVSDDAGNPLQPPARQPYEPPIQAISMARQQAGEDLKATMGLYGAQLGDQGPQESGVAIAQRQAEGDSSTFNYSDNFHRALRHLGRILVDLIPHIYDVPRIDRIIGEDNKEKKVSLVNDSAAPALEEQIQPDDSVEKIYNIGVGTYDVTISAGPSFMTRRQAALDAMSKFLVANPGAIQWMGDLMVENMDWPGASELAKRLKKMVPPQLLEDEDGEAPPQVPPQVQQQLTQLQQQLQAATEQNQQMASQLQGKQLELQSKKEIEQMKLSSAERIEWLRTRIDLVKTEERIANDVERENMKQELQRMGDIIEAQAMGEPV